MTFTDLLTTLATTGALTPSRVKDVRTSLRYLAEALGHPAGADVAPVDEACRDPDRWTAALDTYFTKREAAGQVVSAVTRRNTRNNVRYVFRTAEAQGLLASPLPSRLLQPQLPYDQWHREHGATTPYPVTYRGITKQRYALRHDQWPPDIVQGWNAYRARCGLRIREVTFAKYARELASYFGWIAYVLGRTPVWDDLFIPAQVIAFVRWHATRLGSTLTAHGRWTARDITTIAHVIQHPAHPALAAFSSTLKVPAPVHIKRNHVISLSLLDELAHTMMAEGRVPLVRSRRNGVYMGSHRAIRFQCGLILALLVRVPLRQRNIREMQLGTNLAQDPATGHWHLDFRGDQLKVSHRGAAVNTYQLDLTDYCPDWTALLEEWLGTYRPRLPHADTSPYVFLTQHGTPYRVEKLYESLAIPVARRTGIRFYPHLIRTIWATECLEQTRDFQVAATMLGDTLAVVIKTYYDVVHKDQHAKAKSFLASALHAR